MADKETPSSPPQYNSNSETEPQPLPPDVSNICGLIRITAEWEERKMFSGVKRCQHTETWDINSDANECHIIANFVDRTSPQIPENKTSNPIEEELLPFYFTVHTELEPKPAEKPPKVYPKFTLWSDHDVTPGPLSRNSQQILLERKYADFHLALGLIQTIANSTHGSRFARVMFPWQKQYKVVKTDWQWYGGYWMEGMTENWWSASKEVAEARDRLRTKALHGKVVWKIRSEKEFLVPFRWCVANNKK
ncbi:hypothetical protein BGW36DRAFT_389000 [Talaromyces proteolyticus]|uniref:Uncharacterized protein n=1 Tax=Talaromyces proteolyticus TaxID=1131652 RepID=A0AAD4KKI2_9EURO|nr:uncharacterized protein BGW36DRAFT_389000 [Talaromyces proteolyticus]KAH8690583.1 hypothetical protein BGW36DRAFT_389000 [Talaromyces proteolyticus]